MKYFIKIIKIFGALLFFPIVDPRMFGKILFWGLLLLVTVSIPIIVLGILFGIGIRISNYLIYLWNTSGNDTKLIVSVTFILVFFAALAVFPIIGDLFRKIRGYGSKIMKDAGMSTQP